MTRDRRLIGIVVVCILTELALDLRNITQIDIVWIPGVDTCSFSNAKSTVTGITGTVVCDAILQTSMLVGLLRKRSSHKDGIWCTMLWTQGLIWTTTELITEIPSVVLVYLNFSSKLLTICPNLTVALVG